MVPTVAHMPAAIRVGVAEQGIDTGDQGKGHGPAVGLVISGAVHAMKRQS
jgi:hypothetical protein